MKKASTDNLAKLERENRRIRVLFEGHEIADSSDVLVLCEPGEPPVHYFPRQEVEMSVLGQTSRVTHSRSLGDAVWFTVVRDWHIVENAVWSFEAPPEPYRELAGRLAFLAPHFEFEAEGQTPAEWDAEES